MREKAKTKAGMDLLVLPVLQNTYVGFVVHGSTRQLSFKSSTGSQVQFYVRTVAAYKPLSKLACTCAQIVIKKGLSKYHLGEWPY